MDDAISLGNIAPPNPQVGGVDTGSPDDEASQAIAAVGLVAVLVFGAALKRMPVWRRAAASKSRRSTRKATSRTGPAGGKRRDRGRGQPSAAYEPVVACDDDGALEDD